jgi:hypothetical protein
MVTAGALALGITATALGWAPSRAPTPAPAPPPPPPTRLRAGPVSLEAADAGGQYVTATGTLAPVGTATDRRLATFMAMPGLAGAGCFSFRAADGRFLRHASSRVRLSEDEGTATFRGDATFCVRDGSLPGSASLESFDQPGFFLGHIDDQLLVDRFDGAGGRSFRFRPPLGG